MVILFPSLFVAIVLWYDPAGMPSFVKEDLFLCIAEDRTVC